MDYILGLKGCFNIRKYINEIYSINRKKWEKLYGYFNYCKNVFYRVLIFNLFFNGKLEKEGNFF